MKCILAAALSALAIAASAADAQPARRGPQQLPIAPGFYAYEETQCARADSFFRYDGRRIGWIGPRREANDMEPIRSVRRQGSRWQVEITNRDPDPEMNPNGLTPVMITPRAQGRITVEVQEELPMRLCPASALPHWTRGR